MKRIVEGTVVGLSRTYGQYKPAGESDRAATKFLQLEVEVPSIVLVKEDRDDREEPYALRPKFPLSLLDEAKALVGKKVRVTTTVEEVVE